MAQLRNERPVPVLPGWGAAGRTLSLVRIGGIHLLHLCCRRLDPRALDATRVSAASVTSVCRISGRLSNPIEQFRQGEPRTASLSNRVLTHVERHAIVNSCDFNDKATAPDRQTGTEAPPGVNRSGVTIREVAQRAGVSAMTVSAVLNGKAVEMRISAATQARVLQAAQEMSYSPNAVARSLRRKQTNIIGLYCGHGYLNARLPFLAELIGGAQEACDRHHKDMLLHGAFRGGSVDDIYSELLDGRIDGLIVNAAPLDPLVDRLAASHLPVVAVADPIPSLPSVVVDDQAGIGMALDHLASTGHQRVLYRDTDRPLQSADRRRAAMRRKAADLGMEVTVWQGPDFTRPPDDLLVWADRPRELRPTAALCWNDLTAYDLVARCRESGLSIPQDLAVIGFDGIRTPFDRIWQLTAVRAPWTQVTGSAVDLLVAMLQGAQVPMVTTLPVTLIAGSTA